MPDVSDLEIVSTQHKEHSHLLALAPFYLSLCVPPSLRLQITALGAKVSDLEKELSLQDKDGMNSTNFDNHTPSRLFSAPPSSASLQITVLEAEVSDLEKELALHDEMGEALKLPLDHTLTHALLSSAYLCRSLCWRLRCQTSKRSCHCVMKWKQHSRRLCVSWRGQQTGSREQVSR